MTAKQLIPLRPSMSRRHFVLGASAALAASVLPVSRDAFAQNAPRDLKTTTWNPTRAPAGDDRRKGLHNAIANNPKAAHHPKVPAKGGTETDWQCDDEPDIPCAEQKQACGREHVNSAAFSQQVFELAFGFGFTEVLVQQRQACYPNHGQHDSHQQHSTAKTQPSEQLFP